MLTNIVDHLDSKTDITHAATHLQLCNQILQHNKKIQTAVPLTEYVPAVHPVTTLKSPRSSCQGAQGFWWIIACLQFRPQKHIVWAATYPQCLSRCCGQCSAICQQTRSLRIARWAGCSTSAVSRSACDGSSCSCTSIHPPWITQGTASATSEKKAWRLIFPPSCKRCDYVPRNSFSFPGCPSQCPPFLKRKTPQFQDSQASM